MLTIGEDPETSWRVFEEAVRPLIRIADENDPITKLARSLLTLNEYVNGNRIWRAGVVEVALPAVPVAARLAVPPPARATPAPLPPCRLSLRAFSCPPLLS